MKISDTHSHVDAAQLPLEQLAANPNVSDQAKVAEVSRQFEAVLLRQILTEARKSPSSAGVAGGIYDDMINTQMADSISRSGSFGLARSLTRQLTHQVLPQAAKAANPSNGGQVANAAHAASALPPKTSTPPTNSKRK